MTISNYQIADTPPLLDCSTRNLSSGPTSQARYYPGAAARLLPLPAAPRSQVSHGSLSEGRRQFP